MYIFCLTLHIYQAYVSLHQFPICISVVIFISIPKLVDEFWFLTVFLKQDYRSQQ